MCNSRAFLQKTSLINDYSYSDTTGKREIAALEGNISTLRNMVFISPEITKRAKED